MVLRMQYIITQKTSQIHIDLRTPTSKYLILWKCHRYPSPYRPMIRKFSLERKENWLYNQSVKKQWCLEINNNITRLFGNVIPGDQPGGTRLIKCQSQQEVVKAIKFTIVNDINLIQITNKLITGPFRNSIGNSCLSLQLNILRSWQISAVHV